MKRESWLAVTALAVGTMVACSTEDRSTRGDTVASTRAAVVSATCTQKPWAEAGSPCTTPLVLPGRVTCDDLDLPPNGLDLRFDEGDFDADRQINYEWEPGFFTFAYEGTFFPDGSIGWAVASNYDHDGSTRTFDAVILSGDEDEPSSVFVFDEPQFFVRDLVEAATTKVIHLCNYRPSVTPELPPPPIPTIICAPLLPDGTVGNAGPPGIPTTNLEDIRFEFRLIEPSAPDGTAVSLSATLNGTPLSGASPVLTDDRVTGTYFDERLRGASGTLELRMEYGGNQCAMWFDLQPEGGGGHAW